MSTERTCDFCGYEDKTPSSGLTPDGFIVMQKGQPPRVLRLKVEVDPGLRIETYEAKNVTYNVCTRCLLSFLQQREQGL